MKRIKNITLAFILILILFAPLFPPTKTFAMPFYNLNPTDLVLRASFTTDYSTSSPERKHNIERACAKINKTFVDVNGEFSFNLATGIRNTTNGYKNAKIIVNGKFVEGVGGGVCQVSTTLYNALLLAGLQITEYHPHSLAVSYVHPSFDAMVSYGYSDLRFINNTSNPIIIYANANNKQVSIKIYGQPLKETYQLKSVILGYIEPKDECLIDDLDNDGVDQNLDKPFEKKYVIYPKKGIISQGYLIKKVNGKIVEQRLIRKDKYLPINGVYVKIITGDIE